MADGEDDMIDETPGYKAPKKEALDDMINKDKVGSQVGIE